MSIKKFHKKNSFSFVECWERIQEKTPINNYVQLAEIIGISKSNITKRKDEDLFPIEWAFLVADRYGLTTEWILKGIKVQKNEQKEKGRKFEIFNQAEEWLNEEVKKNPKREIWFEVEFEKTFQEFKKWKEEKEGGDKGKAYTSDRKVA
ncbi:MAG: helix-turn-helix domain-containing protein [Desulfobulbus sp.]|nr:helix-turn-helix domain-containing protein [Desulfobulbus sp.]